MDKYKIYCIPINWEKVQGIRITTSVYTQTKELDTLVKGLLEIAG